MAPREAKTAPEYGWPSRCQRWMKPSGSRKVWARTFASAAGSRDDTAALRGRRVRDGQTTEIPHGGRTCNDLGGISRGRVTEGVLLLVCFLHHFPGANWSGKSSSSAPRVEVAPGR